MPAVKFQVLHFGQWINICKRINLSLQFLFHVLKLVILYLSAYWFVCSLLLNFYFTQKHERKEYDNYATWEVDSAALNKQVEEWAANGLVKQEEAQWAKEDQPAINSPAGECVEGDITQVVFPGSSRIRKKPAWAKDYIVE